MKYHNNSPLNNFVIKCLSIFILLTTFQQQANATASFARATGASCNKCHTANFPRLTVKGERFMQNGFQMLKKAKEGFSLDDDLSNDEEKHSKFKLNKLPEMLSVTGEFNPVEINSQDDTPLLANPEVSTIVAAGSLMQDMPIWVGIDVRSSGASVHRYQMGFTNIIDTTLLNFRMGTLDPTTWTSFYGHGAALQSASSGVGSYGAGHDGDTGFVTVGSGYAERNAVEYYGYKNSWLWSLGLANSSNHHTEESNDPLDFWLTSRYQFWKNSSASFLWYNANGSVENQTFTLAANIRTSTLDFLTQFSVDNTGGRKTTESITKVVRDKWGFTAQMNYAASKKTMGIIRYDVTDNGEKYSSRETQLTMALVLKPAQNIKVTTSYVMELQAMNNSNTASTDGHTHNHKPSPRHSAQTSTDNTQITTPTSAFGDHFKINIRYMF